MNNRVTDPQQELFTALLLGLREQGYDVYDGFLPPEDTPYPFIYLADSHMVDDAGNKSILFGNVYQTVHVWHDSPKRRGTVSGMLGAIKALCRGIRHTDHHAWTVRNMDQRILTDTTTKTPLLHGLLEVEFKFTPRSD